MDLSKLSDEDLLALHNKQYDKLSDDGLQYLHDQKNTASPQQAPNKNLSLSNPNPLGESDFTKPGEAIPKEGGLANFLKYNVAHFNPRSTQNLMGMGMASGGIAEVAGQAPAAVAEKTADFLQPAAQRSEVLSKVKNVEDLEPYVADKVGEAKEAFNAKNISAPYATQRAAGKGRMVAVDLEQLKGVSPEMDAHVARLEAETRGTSAIPDVPTSQPIQPDVPSTDLKPYATDRNASATAGGNDMPVHYTGMEAGQKGAAPQLSSKFGNPLEDKLSKAIENPEITLPPAKQPLKVGGNPNVTYSQDFPANHVDPTNPLSSNKYDPRSLYGLKSNETLIPVEDTFELRKMANEHSRFTKQQMYTDPTAVARNQRAVAAGNHTRAALSDLDPALGEISDKLEEAYALRSNALHGAENDPVTTVMTKPGDAGLGKRSTLKQFDNAAGSDLSGLGQNISTANKRLQTFTVPKLKSLLHPLNAFSEAFDMATVPALRSYDAAAQVAEPRIRALSEFLSRPGIQKTMQALPATAPRIEDQE